MSEEKTEEKSVEALRAELELQKAELKKLRDQINPPPSEPYVYQPVDYTANAKMPASALKAMLDAVPESVTAAIRAEARKPNPVNPPTPSQPTSQVKRGSGWIDERRFPERTKEFELVDRIVASKVGGPNDPVK